MPEEYDVLVEKLKSEEPAEDADEDTAAVVDRLLKEEEHT